MRIIIYNPLHFTDCIYDLGPRIISPWTDIRETLVGGLEPWNFMTFHSVGNVIIPTDFRIFFRGVGIPPTRNYRLLDLCYPMIIPSFTNVNPLLNHQITIETTNQK